jgi:RNA polymerase sigma factor (sigma-70 family)
MLSPEALELSDGQLLERFVSGRQEAALEALVQRHGPMVWSVCRRVLGNLHDAEDAFQAAFLVLVRKAGSVRPRSLVAAWLHGVARQTALKARTTIAKRHFREKQMDQVPEPRPDGDMRDDMLWLLDQELARLPEKYRSVIVVCELEGKTGKEAARQLGLPEGTVASRLARGRALLGKRLAQRSAGVAGASVAAVLSERVALASVPAAVLSATVRAARLTAAGRAGVGAISAAANVLAEGVLKTMLIKKLKALTAVVLVLCLVAFGAGMWTLHVAGAQNETPGQRADLAPPAPEKPGAAKQLEQPAKAPVAPDDARNSQKPETLDVRHKLFKDEDVAALPETLEGLLMRGHAGYGSNTVTDEGIKHLARCTRLRILAAGGLDLSDRSLETIGKLTELEELSLDSNKITAEGLRHLTHLRKLRRLDLNYNQLDPTAAAALARLPNLEFLGINGCRANDTVCELLSHLTNLKRLDLPERTDITDRGLEHLARLRQLENLRLQDNGAITDAGLAAIARMTRLQQLELRNLSAVTPAGLKVLGKLTEMRKLSIDYVAMDEAGIQALAPLTKLEDLLLWNLSPTSPPLEGLGELKSLRHLRTNAAISSSAIRALARLRNLESITDELTKITDDDLVHLARLPKLHTLILGSDKVTAASLPTLATMTSLRTLYVTANVPISADQWTKLGHESLSQCRIALYRPPYTVFHETKEGSGR